MNLDVIPEIQKELWEKLAGVELVTSFYLAGGTAAALHLGHRESIDFDFFRKQDFSAERLIEDLKPLGQLNVQSQNEGTFVGELSHVKLSFFRYPYPLLEEHSVINGLNVAGLLDIAVMKLIAISQRGTIKDFIDVYFLLEAGWNFEAMFEALEQKFVGVHYNQVQILKSLTYFSDAETDTLPKMLVPFNWGQCKRSIVKAAREISL